MICSGPPIGHVWDDDADIADYCNVKRYMMQARLRVGFVSFQDTVHTTHETQWCAQTQRLALCAYVDCQTECLFIEEALCVAVHCDTVFVCVVKGVVWADDMRQKPVVAVTIHSASIAWD